MAKAARPIALRWRTCSALSANFPRLLKIFSVKLPSAASVPLLWLANELQNWKSVNAEEFVKRMQLERNEEIACKPFRLSASQAGLLLGLVKFPQLQRRLRR